MATSSITDRVVLDQAAAEKLAELLKSEPKDDLRRFTKEERAEMDRRSEDALKIIRAKIAQRAGGSK